MDTKVRLSKDRSRRSTTRRSLPAHPSSKVKSRPSSTNAPSTNLSTCHTASSGINVPVDSNTTPAHHAPSIPIAADILQVGSPSDSVLMQRSSYSAQSQSLKENQISNSNSIGGLPLASSPKEGGGGHSRRHHHHSNLYNSIRRQPSLDSSSGSIRGNASDATVGKYSKDGGSTTSQRVQPPKHAFLPWRTSTATSQSVQEDSDDEEFVYPENHVEPRRRSGHSSRGHHQPYSSGTLKGGSVYLHVPDSPYMNGHHLTGSSNGSIRSVSNNTQPTYNAYPADPSAHMLRYSRVYDQTSDPYLKRNSPEAFAAFSFGYGSTSSAPAYHNSPNSNHPHYIHPHLMQASPIPHSSPYYNEFPIPDNLDPERVRLLGKAPHHHHPHPSDLYWGDLRDISAQQHGTRRIFTGRSISALILTLLLIILTGIPLILLCIRPLADTSLVRVHAINATSDSYDFDVIIGASNPNIVPIRIKEVDLDILVGAHLPKTRYGQLQHVKGSENIRYGDMRMAPLRNTKDDDDERSATEELLGHIKTLDTPIFFPSWVTTNASGHVTLENPSSTLGKLIYMLGTYTLQLRGTLTYHTVLVVPYTVPVCTIHTIERGKVRKYEPCSVSDSDEDEDPDGHDESQKSW
ncbi:hypothetical protein SeMB42_g01003 [Synchytrium endobioticum]|uniref:Uncharacterized protein n=1 Tax=Synchytrium endobioticum TaxID=286115 RepID=A0A507DQC0_9FUNG|nr:hypothetical protein SeLEV6574_g07287 [Synchytrium endobioticum]TPX53108.1 hypothetical protein SeMB42_g01003 [Synchytrium endobioticum]